MVRRIFDAISIFRGIKKRLQRPSPRGARKYSAAVSCEGRSGPSKRSSRLAGRASDASGGMNRARRVTQNRVSTNSSSHHALQRSSVRLETRTHSASWLTRRLTGWCAPHWPRPPPPPGTPADPGSAPSPACGATKSTPRLTLPLSLRLCRSEYRKLHSFGSRAAKSYDLPVGTARPSRRSQCHRIIIT
jgi:hypothetical protein